MKTHRGYTTQAEALTMQQLVSIDKTAVAIAAGTLLLAAMLSALVH